MNRRSFLIAAAGAGGASLGWFRYVEPSWFELTRTRVSLAGVKPKRILHISDIHISDGMEADDLEIGLAAGLSQRPDLICFTGDFVSTTSGFDGTGLGRMLRRAADTAPAYAVLGNHDGGAWLARHGGSNSTDRLSELIRSTGVRLLHNAVAVEKDLTLIGVGDFWSGEFQPRHAFEKASASAATLVLCHNPDAKQSLSHLHWDLMLCGHTHGGQARIPGIIPPWAPVSDKRFIAGLYQWERRQIFITRGLGSPKHVRAFCRPEVSLLEIG